MPPGSANRLALFLSSGTTERLKQGASIVASAAALDWEVTVVLMGEALRRFIEDRLDEERASAAGPAAAEEADLQRISSLLASAVAFGRVTFLACTADAQSSGYGRERLLTRVDDVVAMPTILLRIRDAGVQLFI